MGQEKINGQGKRGPCLKASRHQARTPYFSSSARQPNPISIQGDLKKKKNAHATHSHALVGNQEKFICVNRSNREQQNPPSLSKGHAGISDEPKCQRTVQRKGRCTCRKSARVQGSAGEGVCSKKKVLSAQRKDGA